MKTSKQTIIKTAVALFHQYGYDNVSLDQICRECGVTTGAFYHHFKSKSDLLPEYIYLKDTDDKSILTQLIETPDHLEQLWIIYNDRISRRIELGPEMLRQLWANQFRTGTPTISSTQSYLPGAAATDRLVTSIIERAQKKGEVRRGISPYRLHCLFLSAANGLTIDWAVQNGSFDVEQYIRNAFNDIFKPEQ